MCWRVFLDCTYLRVRLLHEKCQSCSSLCCPSYHCCEKTWFAWIMLCCRRDKNCLVSLWNVAVRWSIDRPAGPMLSGSRGMTYVPVRLSSKTYAKSRARRGSLHRQDPATGPPVCPDTLYELTGKYAGVCIGRWRVHYARMLNRC